MTTSSYMKNIIFSVVFVSLILPSHLNAAKLISETKDDYEKRIKWFVEADSGLFIHLGVYSTLGGDWQGKPVSGSSEWMQSNGRITPEEYIPMAAKFKPTKFDAESCVVAAKEAGMDYVIITVKHHDGFCLWDSAQTEFDTGDATSFDRDILTELNSACRRHGLKLGFFYSVIDWHHPSQRATEAKKEPEIWGKDGYINYMKAQCKELVDKYHPSVIWFHGAWPTWWTYNDGVGVYNYLRKLDPDLIINSAITKNGKYKRDFVTVDQTIPRSPVNYPWEYSWTLNNSWGFKKSDTKWKHTKDLIKKEVEVYSRGGNLLLNVGPSSDGALPSASVSRLKELGKWNQAHGEYLSVSRPCNLPQQKWGFLMQVSGSNRDKGQLFASIMQWPKNKKLTVDGLHFEKLDVSTYVGKPLSAVSNNRDFTIDLSTVTPDPHITVLRIKYDGGTKVLDRDVDMMLGGEEIVLKAKAAKLKGRGIRIEERHGNIGYWNDKSATASWKINVRKAGKYNVTLLYAIDKAYAGSNVEVAVQGLTLINTVTPTPKGWQDYKRLDMGVVELEKNPNTTCKVGYGETKAGTLFNLKAVIFEPAE